MVYSRIVLENVLWTYLVIEWNHFLSIILQDNLFSGRPFLMQHQLVITIVTLEVISCKNITNAATHCQDFGP